MPSREFQRELEGMGLHSEGLKECPKCHRQVEKWGKYTFNPGDHPTEPLALHLASCGSPVEEVPALPPVPTQGMAHISEVGIWPDPSVPEDIGDRVPIDTFSSVAIRDEGWYKREYERLMREKAGE